MSISSSSERRLLSQDELEIVRATHHPAIYALDGKELRAVQARLRGQRGKARTLARQRQREMRGKAEARGTSFPGSSEQPLKRKQVFANALKRVNKELDRIRKLEARTAHAAAAQRALALARSEKFVSYPASGDTARDGMHPRVSFRRRTTVPGSKIGRAIKATKVSQAIRDSRA
jgi:hypothetical protein